MKHTVDSIKYLLATNDKAIGRALVALNNRQTVDEQQTESTKYHNNRGFKSSDAKIGTSCANYFSKHGYLTPKQLIFWRKLTKSGRSKIEIYARQLLEQANLNAAKKVTPVKNDADEIEALNTTYTYLKDQYALVIDSYDPATIKPIVDALREIEKRLGLPAYTIGGSVYQGIDSDELKMMEMEAAWDREQTRIDEENKWRARQAMERM